MKRLMLILALLFGPIQTALGASGSDQSAAINDTVFTDNSPCADASSTPATSPSAPVTGSNLDLSYQNGSRPVSVTMYLPQDGKPHPLLIFAPGRGQTSMTNGMYSRYLAATASQGFVVAGVNFSDNSNANNGAAIGPDATDINAIIPKLIAEPKLDTRISAGGVGLFGHSDGGDVVLRVNNNNVKAIISASPDPGGSSKVPLLVMAGTSDFAKSTAEEVYNGLNPPYAALAEFIGSVHTGYLSDGIYSGAADGLTGAFFQRFLEGVSSDSTDLKKLAATQFAGASTTPVTKILDLQEKGSNKATGSGGSPAPSVITNPACCPSSASASTTTLSGGDNEAKVWNFFISKGLKPFQVAGIMGNMAGESVPPFSPTSVEGGTQADVPPAYAAAAGQDANHPGYGIVQWTPGVGLIPIAAAKNQPVNDLSFQLNTLWNQLTVPNSPPVPHTDAGDAVKLSPDVATATEAFRSLFERNLAGFQQSRVDKAISFLNKYGSGGSVGTGGVDPSTASTGSCAAATTGGDCINPFTQGSWGLARTDQGVDFQPTVPSPVVAICDGVVVQASSSGTGWPFDYSRPNDGAFIRYKLTSGSHAGHVVYVSEHIIDITVKVGDKIKAGDRLGTALPGYAWTEWGWAAEDLPDTPLTRPAANDTPPGETVGGKAFARWLRSLGAQTLSDPGPGPEYP